MKFSILVPQLFYDIIARIIPGVTIITCACIVAFGPIDGIHFFTTWSFLDPKEKHLPGWIVLPGNVTGGYVVGALLGGIWYCLQRNIPKIECSQLRSKVGNLFGCYDCSFQTKLALTFPSKRVVVGFHYLNNPY